jgi:nucleoside-diphosphate-sugar epimerase
MKYIITGGLGFIGSHLTELLINNNCNIVQNYNNVLIIDNYYSGIIDNINESIRNNIIIVKDDIRNLEISKYFDEGDIVIHLAAISSLPECQSNPVIAYDINVNGTLNILEICRKKNVKKIIFASTSAVYENNINFPCKENDIVNPSLIYSMSKYTCENLCLSYVKNFNMNISIIRFFNVYGGNQDYRRLSPPLTIYILNELTNNRQPILHSNGEQKRDYVYIDDLMDLILKVIYNNNNLSGKIFNACTCELVSVNEIYNIFKKELNSDIIPIYRDATCFWNKYDNIISGNNPINNYIIEDEVNKFTLGDNTFTKNELNWIPKYKFIEGIQSIIKNKRK